MIIEEEEYLEHFGKKGMKWGQRKAVKVGTAAGGFVKAHKKGVSVTAGVGGAFVAGRILGRHGHISLKDAQTMTNKKGGQLVRDIGHQFVKDSIDKKIVLNYGRQIKEGLVKL